MQSILGFFHSIGNYNNLDKYVDNFERINKYTVCEADFFIQMIIIKLEKLFPEFI